MNLENLLPKVAVQYLATANYFYMELERGGYIEKHLQSHENKKASLNENVTATFHGTGVEVTFNDQIVIDFEFNYNKEGVIDCFDDWKLWLHAGGEDLSDYEEARTAFASLIDKNVFIKDDELLRFV